MSSPSALPVRTDHRHLLPPVRDQGDRGTCLAFALSAAHEAGRAAGVPNTLHYSEEVLYWGAKQIDGDTEEGSTYDSGDGALQRWGQPDAPLWPYDPLRDATAPGYRPPPAAIDPRHCRTAQLEYLGDTVDDIRQELAVGGAVALAMTIYDTFYLPQQGTVAVPAAGAADLGGHAVLVVGYDDAHAGGSLLIRNSWGDAWGDLGHAYVPYAYFDLDATDAYRLVVQP